MYELEFQPQIKCPTPPLEEKEQDAELCLPWALKDARKAFWAGGATWAKIKRCDTAWPVEGTRTPLAEPANGETQRRCEQENRVGPRAESPFLGCRPRA